MSIVRRGRFLLPVLFALAVGTSPAEAQRVGVNTAVNPDASGTPPGGTTRRLVLGQEVVFNEHITTMAAGQTQIQLLDESSVTVGPNSDLTIDQFVYNPNTGTGQLAMSATRGVLRFVGGKLSKNENAVTMQTPAATLAVRGGVFLANLTPTGQVEVVFLYGKGLTVTGGGVTQTIGRPGFAVTVAGRGAVPSYPVPAPPGLLAAFSAALDGRTGGTGGARTPPTDQSIAPASTVISGDIATSIQAAQQSLPVTQPTLINVASLQSNFQLNTVQAQQVIASPPQAPPAGSPAVGFATPTSLAGPIVPFFGTVSYPNSGLQNGSLTINANDLLLANPSVRVIANGQNITNSIGGSAVLSGLNAGGSNTPVSLTVAGTVNGSPTFNGVSLNAGVIATGSATVSSDGQFFTANLTAGGPFLQQFAPNAVGKAVFAVGGVPTIALPTTGVANYTGTAVGSVTPPIGNSFSATGNFSETFNFASRTGTANITNFDGANYSAPISATGSVFAGTLTGPANRSGPLAGLFFGPTAAGVGGLFSVSSPNYLAKGVVAGR
jgi:FecR protein